MAKSYHLPCIFYRESEKLPPMPSPGAGGRGGRGGRGDRVLIGDDARVVTSDKSAPMSPFLLRLESIRRLKNNNGLFCCYLFSRRWPRIRQAVLCNIAHHDLGPRAGCDFRFANRVYNLPRSHLRAFISKPGGGDLGCFKVPSGFGALWPWPWGAVFPS
jgi:hypothetical protein